MPIPSQRIPIEPGQRLAGKYRIEREIGAGAMGVVAEAWHVELDQRVAIKFLFPEFANNLEVAERFRREARAVGRIESEHVAKVIDIGVLETGNIPYYVMEYLPGQDLSRELAERGPLPVGVAVDYVLQACDALAEAHSKGIVHRDLKPANLFLTQRPHGERMIKVLDFGISKFTSASSKQFSMTDTSTLMGSPAYMSPEQLESSRNVDGRADIWSLGVILHELVAGEIPFRGDSVLQLVRSILAGGRTPLTQRGVPRRLDEVVARCLHQDREQRFANIEELRQALLPFSSASPSSAVTSTERGVSPLPRPRGPATPVPSMSLPDATRPVPSVMATPQVEAHTRSASTSWGNTQRGRGWQGVYRRWPWAALALALVGGSYFGVRALLPGRVASPSARSVETVQSLPATERAPTSSASAAKSPAAQSPAALPSTAVPPAAASSAAASPAAVQERALTPTDPLRIQANVPAEPAARAPTSEHANRTAPAVPPAAQAQRAPAARGPDTQRAKAEGTPAQAAAMREPRTGGEAAPSEPGPAKNAEPHNSAAPARSLLDIPDYGGRE